MAHRSGGISQDTLLWIFSPGQQTGKGRSDPEAVGCDRGKIFMGNQIDFRMDRQIRRGIEPPLSDVQDRGD